MLGPALILALSSNSLATETEGVWLDDDTRPRTPISHEAARAEDLFERRFSLEVRLGMATPTGAIGVAAEYAFIPRFAAGLGVGSNLIGPEYAAWLRYRMFLRPDNAFSISSGLSTARFNQNNAWSLGALGMFGILDSMSHSTPAPDRDWQHAYWVNTDVDYDWRRGERVCRFFLGFATLLNPGGGVVEPETDPNADKPGTPLSGLIYAGFGVGFSE